MFGRLFVNVSGGQLPMANNCPPSERIKEEAVMTAIHYSLLVPAHRAGFEFSSGSVENSNSTAGGVEAYRYSVLHVLVQATETRPLISSQRLAVHVYIMMCPHQKCALFASTFPMEKHLQNMMTNKSDMCHHAG